jgi:hypothetical protein
MQLCDTRRECDHGFPGQVIGERVQMIGSSSLLRLHD